MPDRYLDYSIEDRRREQKVKASHDYWLNRNNPWEVHDFEDERDDEKDEE